MFDDKFWFEQNLEQEINDTIAACYPASWDENLITESLLIALGKFLKSKTYYDSLTGITTIDFAAYKFSGTAETQYGDIALLTSVKYDNGEVFKGVANFEAKRRLENDFKYRDESSIGQYRRIVKNAPYSQLLIYDYEPISQHIKTIYDSEYLSDFSRLKLFQQQFSRCVTSPLYMSVGRKVTRNHLRYARTLTEQLCRRIFYGVDLHLDPLSTKAVYDFDGQKKKHPRFVATLKVVHGNTDIINDADLFTIPTEVYNRIQ